MDLLQGHVRPEHGSDAGGSPEAAARNTSGGRLCTDAWYCIRVCVLACIRAGPCISVDIGTGTGPCTGFGTCICTGIITCICTAPRRMNVHFCGNNLGEKRDPTLA